MDDKAIDAMLDWLKEEINNHKDDIKKKNETINSLEKLSTEFGKIKKYKEYKEKYQKVNDDFEKEKARLIKLHDHYKKLENENENLKTSIDGWKNWFSQNKEIFDRLFSAAPPSNLTMDTSPSKDKTKKSKDKK